MSASKLVDSRIYETPRKDSNPNFLNEKKNSSKYYSNKLNILGLVVKKSNLH